MLSIDWVCLPINWVGCRSTGYAFDQLGMLSINWGAGGAAARCRGHADEADPNVRIETMG
jgi:hypothetical protein